MTIGSEASRSVGSFLSEIGPNSAASSSESIGDRFEAALRKSLGEVGISTEDVVLESSGGGLESGKETVIRLIISEAPAATCGCATESSTGTATPAASSLAVGGEQEVGLPPYDPLMGPRITREMWTEELLTDDLTQETLWNIQNPAEFLNARGDMVTQPTDIRTRSLLDARTWSVNPGFLSTREQAEAMLTRLRSLGIDAGEIREYPPTCDVVTVDYFDDPRRFFFIGDMNVGGLLWRYAKNTVETADQMTLDEFHTMEAAAASMAAG